MEFKIKLLQFNITALCLTDFVIDKFWVRIFTVNNFLVTFLWPPIIWWEKNNDLILSNIVSVFYTHFHSFIIKWMKYTSWVKKYIFFYAAVPFCVPDLNILSSTHLDKILTGLIWKFLFLNPFLTLLDLKSWTYLLLRNLVLHLGVMKMYLQSRQLKAEAKCPESRRELIFRFKVKITALFSQPDIVSHFSPCCLLPNMGSPVTWDPVPLGLHSEPILFANLSRNHTHFFCVGILSFQWIEYSLPCSLVAAKADVK